MNLLNEETALELIDKFRSNVSAIARARRVNRSSVIAFIERRPKLLQAVRDARAAMCVDEHQQLAMHVAEGKQWAVKHALRTAGPDEFDSRNDNPEPELTDEERMYLINELFESIKKREEARARSNEAAAATPDLAEQPSSSPSGISVNSEPLQQISTNDGSEQHRCDPSAAQFVDKSRQQEVQRKPNCGVAQVDWGCDFCPSFVEVIPDSRRSCSYNSLQHATTDNNTQQHTPRRARAGSIEALRKRAISFWEKRGAIAVRAAESAECPVRSSK